MSLADSLPPSLNLPSHLSAQKYFYVCSLTVLAWDTLVLSPRTWRLLKTSEWPPLKVLFHFMRIFMPLEFIIVAVAFFDTKWSQEKCQHFFLFEPICTAILLASTSAVHVIRIHAIYNKNRAVLALMTALFALQVVVTAVACGFFRSVPLDVGQGCIAGPKHNWVGIYWVAPTLLYTVSFALAANLSFKSRTVKPINLWKLMLRDGLNLYGAIWVVNMVNVIFWFVMTPTGPEDPVKTIVTSMAAVLTTSMTLRIILSVRGSLAQGGSFAGSSHANSTSRSTTTHVLSGGRTGGALTSLGGGGVGVTSAPGRPTFTLDSMRGKPEAEWTEDKESVGESKAAALPGAEVDAVDVERVASGDLGVKITIDREVGYDESPYARGRK